ncbi:MAG: DUF58 domain-containing protein, partial [Bacteroidetes bacterium]|nr:DUF58 domain-containing protein [Bacteroidota bacterium]
VFITDLYEEKGEIIEMMNSLTTMKHEVIVFHIMGNNELNFDYKGYAALEDLETGNIIRINTLQKNEAYQGKINHYLSVLRMKLLNKNIFYCLLNMAQPLDQALRDFLNQRNKLSV